MSNTDLPPSQEVIIVLMGPTGTGKSTFINLLTNDESIRIGNDLHSHTFDVNTSHLPQTGITFADTPGFDDSREGVTDTDILGKIVSFLQGGGGKGRRINGIIYLHRISDPRMGGTTKKNLRMFMELCGNNNFEHVRIVTTRWKNIDEGEGGGRETELTDGAFKPLIDGGARMLRHDGGRDSAQFIVSQFAEMTPVKLKIQEELDAGWALGDTSAGAVVLEGMKQVQAKHEKEMEELKKEMDEAGATDRGLRAELAEERRKLEAQQALAGRDREILRVGAGKPQNLMDEVSTTGIVSQTAPGPHASHQPMTPEAGLTVPSSKAGYSNLSTSASLPLPRFSHSTHQSRLAPEGWGGREPAGRQPDDELNKHPTQMAMELACQGSDVLTVSNLAGVLSSLADPKEWQWPIDEDTGVFSLERWRDEIISPRYAR